jgi:hypothetical protein
MRQFIGVRFHRWSQLRNRRRKHAVRLLTRRTLCRKIRMHRQIGLGVRWSRAPLQEEKEREGVRSQELHVRRRTRDEFTVQLHADERSLSSQHRKILSTLPRPQETLLLACNGTLRSPQPAQNKHHLRTPAQRHRSTTARNPELSASAISNPPRYQTLKYSIQPRNEETQTHRFWHLPQTS